MDLKLDVLDNSYDYLTNSLDTYKTIHEYVHDEDRTMQQDAARFKITFVTLVQALELLLKDILITMHECLIYSNIDAPKDTVNVLTAIKRINRYNNIKIQKSDIEFIEKCIEKRNQFMHYDVDIKTQDIKTKYLKLFELYKNIHKAYKGKDIIYPNNKYLEVENSILNQAKDFNVFRGQEFCTQELEIYKEDLQKAQKHTCFITNSGEKVKRIKYGEEINHTSFESPYTYKYCGDCSVEQGEYHLDNCDCELCPVCKKQVLSCGCIKDWSK